MEEGQNSPDLIFEGRPQPPSGTTSLKLLHAMERETRIEPVAFSLGKPAGYNQEEACGRLIYELVIPKESSAEAEEYTRRPLHGKSLNVEAVRKHKDGTRVHVSILSAPVSIAGSPRRPRCIRCKRYFRPPRKPSGYGGVDGAQSNFARVGRGKWCGFRSKRSGCSSWSQAFDAPA